jgi:hypothetical protein
MLGILLTAAAAAQLSAPVPLNLKEWVTPSDWPPYMLQKTDVWWDVGVRLVVAADGTLRACIIQTRSGSSDADQLTCDLIRKRARFQPARWTDGSPVTGVYSTTVAWISSTMAFYAPMRPPKGHDADLDVSVEQLPPGLKSPSLVRAMFAVDESGKISSCSAETSENYIKAENDPVLVPIACAQIQASFAPLSFKDSSGKPVRSVQDALVRFVKSQ